MVQVGFASHSGRRASNQDNALVDVGASLFAVADGVGGGASGEEAAALVCNELLQAHRRGQPLSQGILNGHQELRKLARGLDQARYCASTIASLMFYQHRAEVAWVGDSRVYLVRDGQLLQMTTDHSVAGQRHVLTQALGAPLPHPLRVDLVQTGRQEGDIWLLCSDGLHTVVDDQVLLDHLCTEGSAQRRADRLLELALQRGADDNVTLILILDAGRDDASEVAPVVRADAGGRAEVVSAGGPRRGTWFVPRLKSFVFLGLGASLVALALWIISG